MGPDPDPTDASLVARISERDEAALSSLYDRHRRVIFALALRVLRDRAEAEEVVLDVFQQVWRSAGGYDPLRGSVGGWLFTLCRSRALDRLRAHGRRKAAHEALASEERSGGAPTASASDGPDVIADRDQRRAIVSRALGGLAPVQRVALELAYYEGLSHSEIAARLEAPLGTVKTRIRQAILALRESLGAAFEP